MSLLSPCRSLPCPFAIASVAALPQGRLSPHPISPFPFFFTKHHGPSCHFPGYGAAAPSSSPSGAAPWLPPHQRRHLPAPASLRRISSTRASPARRPAWVRFSSQIPSSPPPWPGHGAAAAPDGASASSRPGATRSAAGHLPVTTKPSPGGSPPRRHHPVRLLPPPPDPPPLGPVAPSSSPRRPPPSPPGPELPCRRPLVFSAHGNAIAELPSVSILLPSTCLCKCLNACPCVSTGGVVCTQAMHIIARALRPGGARLGQPLSL